MTKKTTSGVEGRNLVEHNDQVLKNLLYNYDFHSGTSRVNPRCIGKTGDFPYSMKL